MHLSPAAIESAIACWSRRVFVSTRVGIFRRAVIVVPRVGSPNGLIPTIRTSLKEFDPQMAVDFTTASDVVEGAHSAETRDDNTPDLRRDRPRLRGDWDLRRDSVRVGAAQRPDRRAHRALGATSSAVFRPMLFEAHAIRVSQKTSA
jgi:hypothetical protein